MNGTDQEEIRTGERCRTAGPGLGAAGRCVARPGVLPSSAFWLRGWESAGTGIECMVKRGAAFSVCCTLNLCQKSLLEAHKVYSRW